MSQANNQLAQYSCDFKNNGGTVVEGGQLVYLGTQSPVTSLGGLWVPPTSDPHVVGAVWNSAGTLTISAG